MCYYSKIKLFNIIHIKLYLTLVKHRVYDGFYPNKPIIS